MKFVEGLRLDVYRNGRPGISNLLRVFSRICEPVAFAHARGIVHRDLKPENVMIGKFGEVLVLDWGVARALGSAEESAAVVGTAGFMAPEQAAASDVDARTDVYALGRILRFLLEGEQVRRPLQAICEKAGFADPSGRYFSAVEMAADVERFLNQEPVLAYREPFWERATRLAMRNRALIFLLLAYLIMRTLAFLLLRH